MNGKRSVLGVYFSFPFSAELKNERICTSAATYAFMALTGTTLHLPLPPTISAHFM